MVVVGVACFALVMLVCLCQLVVCCLCYEFVGLFVYGAAFCWWFNADGLFSVGLRC